LGQQEFPTPSGILNTFKSYFWGGTNTQQDNHKHSEVAPKASKYIDHHEGVVAIRSLPCGLVIAVYTNGLVRVVHTSDAMLAHQYKLGTDGGKVINAKLAFNAVESSNSLVVAVAIGYQLRQTQNGYRIQVTNLHF
jgi:hypothetical protein